MPGTLCRHAPRLRIGPKWGKITVRCGADSVGAWLEVYDNGIGMSTAVLTDVLLDFGSSYWNTDAMLADHPGLLASGFQPIGQFGIGFFSAFMWGEPVQVITRRYSDGAAETHVLEFKSGLDISAVLRKARPDEARHVQDGGTLVRLRMKESRYSRFSYPLDIGEAFPENPLKNAELLRQLCRMLAPAIDVDLFVEGERGDRERIVAAGDWQRIERWELLLRLVGESASSASSELVKQAKLEAGRLRPIIADDQSCLGLACLESLASPDDPTLVGQLVIKGFLAESTSNLLGVVFGDPSQASRSRATPKAKDEVLRRWASEQAKVAIGVVPPGEKQFAIASVIYGLGCDTGPLPICLGAESPLTAAEVSGRRWDSEVWLIPPGVDIDLAKTPNALIVGDDVTRLFGWTSDDESLESLVIKCVATAWGYDPEQIRVTEPRPFPGTKSRFKMICKPEPETLPPTEPARAS